MLAGTLAFALGIYCLLQFSFLPSFWVMALLPVIFSLCRFFSGFRIIFTFLIGFCWALISVNSKIQQTLEPGIEGKQIIVRGIVASLPEIHNNHVRFLIKPDEIKNSKDQEYTLPGLIRLSWYYNKVIPKPGESWQFQIKLKRPYGFMNPGGFDYETWLFRQNIKAIGYITSNGLNQKLKAARGHYIQRLRYKLAYQLKETLDKPLLGIVLALSLGDRSQLDAQQWKTLSKTGTSHLIAISGLHLGLIAGFIYFLVRYIWSRFYFTTQIMPAPMFASIMAFIFALFYALLAGFALPAQRALIMIAVFLIISFSARQALISNIICIAVVLVLIMDPMAIIAADFWLSFMAVIFILYVARYRQSNQDKLSRWVRLQCLLTIALCPLLIFWFKQIPLFSVLANLLAIPIIGFLIVPLIMVATIFLFPLPSMAHFLYSLIEKINAIQWSWLEFLSQQKNVVIPIASPNVITLVIATLGVFILLMPRGLFARWIGIFYLMPLLFPSFQKLNPGEYDFNLLDVGQGLAAIIKTREHVLVYDTGARFSDRFNIGDAVLTPYLKYKGINQVSMLIISHGDNDHIGGANALIENFEINKTLSSVPEQLLTAEAENCHAGQNWTWDKVNFEIIHPQFAKTITGNNSSCVVKVSSAYGSVLLTGDIEKQAEMSLLKSYGDNLKADILLVPHHGSRTSSTKEFISTVSPDYAFFPVGYRNRFGFPKQDIISRYETHGIETLVSYETGEISAKFRDGSLQIDKFRTKNRRFWHHYANPVQVSE